MSVFHPGDGRAGWELWLPRPASRERAVPRITSLGKAQNSKHGFLLNEYGFYTILK